MNLGVDGKLREFAGLSICHTALSENHTSGLVTGTISSHLLCLHMIWIMTQGPTSRTDTPERQAPKESKRMRCERAVRAREPSALQRM